ncbi:MAG: AMIN domain-containing protein, partial [Candidatus Competibacteraceae bacterium]
MTSRSTSEGRQAWRSGGEWLPRWLVALGLIGGLWLAGGWQGVMAEEGQPVLQAVDISPLAGNRLQIRFRLSERPKAPPSTFTIDDPARIVLDFLDTRNGLSARQQAINVGVADRISVLEGADRTRASLNLARLVPYRVDVQGNAVLLTLDNAGAPPARTLSSWPPGSAPPGRRRCPESAAPRYPARPPGTAPAAPGSARPGSDPPPPTR